MSEPVLVSGGKKSQSGKRLALFAGGGVAVLLIALVLPKLLFGGGEEDEGFSDLPVAAAAPAPATPAVGPAGGRPAEVLGPFSSRDPFEPLVATGGAAEAPTAPAVPAAPPAPLGITSSGPAATLSPPPAAPAPIAPAPVPIAPTPVPIAPTPFPVAPTPIPVAPATSGEPPPTSTTTAPPPAEPAPVPIPPPDTHPGERRRQRFTVVSTFRDQQGRPAVTLRLDDAPHTVSAGQTFGEFFRVVSLDVSRQCGTFLFGDDQFEACQGDELLK